MRGVSDDWETLRGLLILFLEAFGPFRSYYLCHFAPEPVAGERNPMKMTRQAILLLLAGFLHFSPAWAEAEAPSIYLTHAIYFTAPDGADVVVFPGEYSVSREAEAGLRLVDSEFGNQFLVKADRVELEEKVTETTAVSIREGENEHHIALLLPSGEALDAIGRLTPVQTRALPRTLSGTRLYSTAVNTQPTAISSKYPTTTPAPVQAQCGSVTVQIPAQRAYPLSYVLQRGGGFLGSDLGDRGSKIVVDVRSYLRTTPMRIWLTSVVRMEGSDTGAVFYGSFGNIFFDAREYPGCEVDRIEAARPVGSFSGDPIGDAIYGHVRAMDLQQYSAVYSGSGIIDRAACVTGLDGPIDTGRVGCQSIRFHPITVHLKPERTTCGEVQVANTWQPLVFPLAATSWGDNEIGGSPRTIRISAGVGRTAYASILDGGARVRASGRVRIEETINDLSMFERNWSGDLLASWDVPYHCRIVGLKEAPYVGPVIEAPRDHAWRHYPSRDFIRDAYCRTDTKGDDDPSGQGIGCILSLSPITVRMANK